MAQKKEKIEKNNTGRIGDDLDDLDDLILFVVNFLQRTCVTFLKKRKEWSDYDKILLF